MSLPSKKVLGLIGGWLGVRTFLCRVCMCSLPLQRYNILVHILYTGTITVHNFKYSSIALVQFTFYQLLPLFYNHLTYFIPYLPVLKWPWVISTLQSSNPSAWRSDFKSGRGERDGDHEDYTENSNHGKSKLLLTNRQPQYLLSL